MYFCCAFFYTILTVAQNTQRGNFIIIPECYIVSLVYFDHLYSPGVYHAISKTDSVKYFHPIWNMENSVPEHQNSSFSALFSTYI